MNVCVPLPHSLAALPTLAAHSNMLVNCLLPAALLFATVACSHTVTEDKGDKTLPLTPSLNFTILGGQCTGLLEFDKFIKCPTKIDRVLVTVTDYKSVNIYISDALTRATITRQDPCLGDPVLKGSLTVGCTVP